MVLLTRKIIYMTQHQPKPENNLKLLTPKPYLNILRPAQNLSGQVGFSGGSGPLLSPSKQCLIFTLETCLINCLQYKMRVEWA